MQNFGHGMSNRMVNGLKELSSSGTHDSAVKVRIDLYYAGFDALFVNPFFGYGIGNLVETQYQFLAENQRRYSHFHNIFLNHIIAGGLVGLLFLLMLSISPLLILWQKRDVISSNGIYLSFLIVIVIFGAGMSNVLFFHDLLAGFFSVLILIAAIVSNTQDK